MIHDIIQVNHSPWYCSEFWYTTQKYNLELAVYPNLWYLWYLGIYNNYLQN